MFAMYFFKFIIMILQKEMCLHLYIYRFKLTSSASFKVTYICTIRKYFPFRLDFKLAGISLYYILNGRA